MLIDLYLYLKRRSHEFDPRMDHTFFFMYCEYIKKEKEKEKEKEKKKKKRKRKERLFLTCRNEPLITVKRDTPPCTLT